MWIRPSCNERRRPETQCDHGLCHWVWQVLFGLIFLSSYGRHVAGASLLLFVHHRPNHVIDLDGLMYVITDLAKLDKVDFG